MSIENEGYVKTLEELLVAQKRDEFNALYEDVVALLEAEQEYTLLTRVYLCKAVFNFQISRVDEIIPFIGKHLNLFQNYANEEDLYRFKNIRLLALDTIGYREDLLAQMLEIKTYAQNNAKWPLFITATINVGLLHMREQQEEEAIAYFKEAHELAAKYKAQDKKIFHDYFLTINNLFAVYITQRRLDEAAGYLHLQQQFKQTYPRFYMLYRFNEAQYYALIRNFEKGDQLLKALQHDIYMHPENEVYMQNLLETELTFAQERNDKQYEKEIYKKLIILQKQNNNEKMLQLIMQRSYDTKREELIQVAQCDPLTKLLNRRGYLQQTEKLKRREQHNAFIACAMVDIDHFKQINDKEGHLAGDTIIRTVAAVLKRYEQQGYVCARYGGDEFLLTFTASTGEYIEAQMKQLFEQLQQTEFSYENQKIHVTFTIGAIYMKRQETCAVTKLLALADEAMYEVKRAGRAYYAVKPLQQTEVIDS